MFKTARLVVLLATMLSCVGCDQITKSVARAQLVPGQTISVFGDVLRLQYAQNPGAFLSIGHSLSAGMRGALFTFGGVVLTGLALAWVLVSRRMTTIQTVGVALICGGGVGNLIDRFTHGGYVTDFLNVGIGSVLRTGIFNVADFALLLGALLIVVSGAGRIEPAP